MADVGLVGLTNVVCQVGIAQQAVAARCAHRTRSRRRRGHPDLAAALRGHPAQLDGYPCVRPHGGWSLLIDTAAWAWLPAQASERLFTRPGGGHPDDRLGPGGAATCAWSSPTSRPGVWATSAPDFRGGILNFCRSNLFPS